MPLKLGHNGHILGLGGLWSFKLRGKKLDKYLLKYLRESLLLGGPLDLKKVNLDENSPTKL